MKNLNPMKYFFLGLWGLACLMASSQVWADQGGGAGASGLEQAISQRLNPPQTNFFFSFAANAIEEGVGSYFLLQLEGAYAPIPRFSVGGRLPFWVVRQDFAPDNQRIGDVTLTLKGEIWRNLSKRMNLLMGLDTSFPTGNDEESLGAGAFVVSPYYTFNKDFEFLQFFTTILGFFESGPINPTVEYAVGVLIPVVQGEPSLDFLMGFQGITFVVSDTFNRGSTKGYVVPGIVLGLNDHWEASFIGKISVADSLGRLPDVEEKDFITSFFSDIRASFIFNLGYKF